MPYPYRTLVALLTFAACAGLATQLPHPTRDGVLVASLVPDLSNLGGSDTFVVPPAADELRIAAVALPPAAATPTAATPTATPPTAAPPTATPPSAAPAASAATRDVLAAIDALVIQLGPDPMPLVRPCLDGDDARGCRRRALDRFYEGLLRVALGAADKPVRFSQFGDSLTAREHFPSELRRLLQAQFGDGGHGFLPVSEPGNGVYAANVAWSGSGYTGHDIAWNTGFDFGVGGAVWRPTREATTSVGRAAQGIGARIERVGLLYVPPAGAASVIASERGGLREVSLRGPPGQARVAWLPWSGGTLTLAGWQGNPALHGLLVESGGPGVIVDNLGIVSSRMPFLTRIERRRMAEELALLDPTLVSFFFGGVTAEDKGWGTMPERAWADGYRADYGAALAQVRGDQPQRDCLVLSTLTRAVDENGRIAVFPSVPLRVEAQRAEATKNGCAFWNTYEAIGGRDGPARWVAHRPRLLALDLRHPTREGYQRLARMFYASLMHGFRGWLVERLGRGA